jgi:hypothetical protein
MAVGFRRDIALFIADAARCLRTVTDGDLALRFGGISRGWGLALNAIVARLRKLGHPLLPVLVVVADTGMQSTVAAIYRNLDLVMQKRSKPSSGDVMLSIGMPRSFLKQPPSDFRRGERRGVWSTVEEGALRLGNGSGRLISENDI